MPSKISEVISQIIATTYFIAPILKFNYGTAVVIVGLLFTVIIYKKLEIYYKLIVSYTLFQKVKL